MEHWTVIAVFDNQEQAQAAINELRQAGFSDDEIGYVYRQPPVVLDKPLVADKNEAEEGEKGGPQAGGVIGGVLGAVESLLAPVRGSSESSSDPQSEIAPVDETGRHIEGPDADEDRDVSSEEETTKLPIIQASGEQQETTDGVAAPETNTAVGADEAGAQNDTADVQGASKDTVTGAIAGSIVGGALGGAAAALVIPVLGPALAGGILIAAFTAALGVVAGGALGAFVAMGIPEEQARYYEQELAAGRTIVTVKSVERRQNALDILSRSGASYANAHDSL